MTEPLAPITTDEVVATCDIIREAYIAQTGHPADAKPRLRFPVVQLFEPDRAARRTGRPQPRQLEAFVVERNTGLLSEVVVDLDAKKVTEWRTVPGAHPPLLFGESMSTMTALLADERFIAAVARRGITDMAHVQVDPWPAGNFGLPEDDGRRIVRCVAYYRESDQDNGYAYPLEGLIGVVDCATDEVIAVEDTFAGTAPPAIPPLHGRYGPADVQPQRQGIKPLDIAQPEGPSFTVTGNAIEWLGWTLRFTVNPVEGLVLHELGYLDRPILDRASVAEMVVPYGARGLNHWWKNAFDVGEWGLGRLLQPLTLGCDCLGEIVYADAVFPDENGGARVVPNAICMHEEDYGILWKHANLWAGDDQVRRSRRFVISFISTVGNYDYGFFWYLYLDGTIQLEVKLTGIMQTAACDVDATEAPDNGSMIAPGLWGPNHQHLFCARLDVNVDGPDNSVEEIDAVPADDFGEHGNEIVTKVTPLTTELQARRMGNSEVARRWRIVNPHARNGVGRPTSYALVSASPVTLLAHPDSAIAKRATFATKNLWVTPYEPDERRPAGNHPNQHPGGAGLPEWTKADRPIVDRPLTVWHTFGVSHLPRPEDWPVMPVEYAGFHLKPVGFFDRNPALDLPPSHSDHCAD